MLLRELQDFCRQIEAINAEALRLLRDLNEEQFNWSPGPRLWSIAQCIDHLVVTGRSSLLNMEHSIAEGRSRGSVGGGPFRYRVIERWFVRQMEPPVRLRFKAPKAYEPTLTQDHAQTIEAFHELQEHFLCCAREADGLDLSAIKVNNAATRWFRLSLGQELAFNAAHERRHLWQARLVREAPVFPGQSTAF